MHFTNYSSNYYSISDILVTQEKIPCIAETPLAALGAYDSSFDSENVAAGQTLELPLWYAQYSSTPRMRTLTFQVPDVYQKKLKEICEADALAVDLGRMNKFFYELGLYVVPYDRTASLSTMLYETCRQRCRSLIDLCKDTNKELKGSKKFEYAELELYAIGCRTNELFAKWLSGTEDLLHTPIMVTNHQKRRRAMLEGDSEENTRLSKSPRL